MTTGDQDKEELVESLRDSFLHLRREPGFNLAELIGLFKDSEPMIPCSLFKEQGSPLSLLVKYCIDVLHLPLRDLPKRINRSYRALWGAHHKIKGSTTLNALRSDHYVSLSCFSPGLSVMEAVCSHLKNSQSMTYHEIAVELRRDDRTVWTHYHRALQKMKKR